MAGRGGRGKRRFIPSHNSARAPIGAPTFPRPVTNPSARIQVLSRPQPDVIASQPPEAPGAGVSAPTGPSLPASFYPHDPPQVPENWADMPDPSDNRLNDYLNNVVDLHVRAQNARHGLGAESNESPLSSAPVSLEDFVKHKPSGRGRANRGARQSIVASANDVSRPQEEQEPQPAAPTVAPLTAAPAPATPAGSPVPLTAEALALVQLNLGIEPRPVVTPSAMSTAIERIMDPPPGHKEGAFRQVDHSNGDISVLRWSESPPQWSNLGRVAAKDADFLQTIFDVGLCSYFIAVVDVADDEKHTREENQAAAVNFYSNQEHVIQKVKKLVENHRLDLEKTGSRSNVPFRPASPLTQHIQNYEQQYPTRDFNPVTFAPENPVPVRSVPPGPTLPKHFAETTNQGPTEMKGFPNVHAPSYHADHSSYNMPPASFQQFESAYAQNVDVFGGQRNRGDYRESERRQLAARLLNSSRQTGSFADQYGNVSTSARLGIPHGNVPAQGRAHPDFALQHPARENDMRRTVLHDPLLPAGMHSFGQMPHSHASSGTQNYLQDPRMRHQADLNTNQMSSAGPGTSRTLAHGSVPDDSHLAVWRDPNSAPPGPTGFSSLSWEEVRASVPLVPQKTSGPYFTGKSSFVTKEEYEKEYKKELNDWWYSGVTRAKQQEETMKSSLPQTERSGYEEEVGTRLMGQLHGSLKEYEQSQHMRASGARDHFAPFSKPPANAVDTSQGPQGTQSFFSEPEPWKRPVGSYLPGSPADYGIDPGPPKQAYRDGWNGII